MTRSLKTVGRVPATVDDPRLKSFLESMRQRLDAHESQIIAIEASLNVEPWRGVGAAGEPGFQNSWVNQGTTNSAAAFYKDPFGWVRVKGVIKTGAIGSIAFTLPPGFRPLSGINIPAVSNSLFGSIFIDTGGNVMPSVGSSVWFSLDGTGFRV